MNDQCLHKHGFHGPLEVAFLLKGDKCDPRTDRASISHPFANQTIAKKNDMLKTRYTNLIYEWQALVQCAQELMWKPAGCGLENTAEHADAIMVLAWRGSIIRHVTKLLKAGDIYMSPGKS